MKKKASLTQYHRAVVHIWAELTASRPRSLSLTEVCKLHGVSTTLPTALRREGFITGSRRAAVWTGDDDSPPSIVCARWAMDRALADMQDRSPRPAPAPVSAPAPPPQPAPVQLVLDPEADLREQVAALTAAVSALVSQQAFAP